MTSANALKLAEMREAFIAGAEASAAEIDAGAPLYAAEDVHAYITARAAVRTAVQPRPIRMARRWRFPQSAARSKKRRSPAQS